MTFALIYASVSAVCAAIMYLLCVFAPLGYETEDGFFYGAPD